MIPIDRKGIRNNMLVLNKLSNPFSPGEIYSGLVKTTKSKKDTPFAKKLVNA